MSLRGWALGAFAALVVLIAAAGGFLSGRRTIPTSVVPVSAIQHPVTPLPALPLPVAAVEEPTPAMQTANYEQPAFRKLRDGLPHCFGEPIVVG